MAVITPTTPTFTAVLAPVVLASGTTLGATPGTLDLRTSLGAILNVRIGRRVATALTRSGYVLSRRTNNGNSVLPTLDYSRYSGTVAAASSTVSSGGASGSNQVVLASGTGFAAGDVICLHSDDTSALRVEWARVIDVTSATLTVDRNFRTSHSSADRVTNQADMFSGLWLPGGDIWEVQHVNNSGQSLLFAIDAEIHPSYTSA